MLTNSNKISMQDMIDDVSRLWFGSEGKSDPNEQGYVGLCLAGEVGELCNYIKKELRSSEFRETKDKEIAMEIPDIIFYLARLIAIRGYNVDRLWHTKMNHNELKYGRALTPRPYNCICADCLTRREQRIKNGN